MASVASDPYLQLSSKEVVALKKEWAYVLNSWGNDTFDIVSVIDTLSGAKTPTSSSATSLNSQKDSTNHKRGGGLFGMLGGGSGANAAEQDPTKDLNNPNNVVSHIKDAMDGTKPDVIKDGFWKLLRNANPDKELVKFLKARNDPAKASIAFTKTIRWKTVDHDINDIIMKGEYGIFKNKEEGVMKNLKLQKGFIIGYDNKNRPAILVRPRLHSTSHQTPEELEKYVLLIVEELRLFFRDNLSKACLLFDLSGFSLSNMDYTAVKFIIQVFETHYPEYLSELIVYNPPWVFSGIWKVVKAWFDPEVAGKVKFTYNYKDLLEFFDESQIPEYLGGGFKAELDKYTPPDGSHDEKLKDKEGKDALITKRNQLIQEFTTTTVKWIQATSESETSTLWKEKLKLGEQIMDNYVQLDPYVRSRSAYDINGRLKVSD